MTPSRCHIVVSPNEDDPQSTTGLASGGIVVTVGQSADPSADYIVYPRVPVRRISAYELRSAIGEVGRGLWGVWVGPKFTIDHRGQV